MTTPNQIQAQVETMSSLELVDVINDVRKTNGKRRLLHEDFLKKIENHPGIDSRKFFRHVPCLVGNNATRDQGVYHLPRRECDLLLMSESLLIQAQVYDRLTEVMQSHAHQQLTQAEVARIEHDYAENGKHHHFYKLGESLNTAVIMDEYDEATEIDREIDKLDLSVAARAYGIPEDRVRSRIFTHTAAVRYLGRMERGEHMHSNRVLEVVAYASSSAKSREEQKALMHKAVKPKPLPNPTIGDIVAHDLAHKHARSSK